MTKDATIPASGVAAAVVDGGGTKGEGENEYFSAAEIKDLDPKLQALVRKNSKPGPFGLKTQVVWTNIYLMVVLHCLMVWGFYVGLGAKIQSHILYVVVGMCSAVGVTAGAHRLWTHRSYKARLPLKILLMCFDCIAMQNSILVWSRDHRLHHKYTETDADPHNANRGFFFAHVGWLLMLKHPQVLIKGRNIDLSDLRRDPIIAFQHRYYLPLCVLFTILIPSVVAWYFWNEQGHIAFLYLFAFRYVISLHCTWFVNSAAHLWGDRPYDKTSMTADNAFVCYAALGEGWHNYHHAFPYDYSTGEWGPKMNVTTCFLDMCAAFGLVYDRRQMSQEGITNMRRRKGNLSDN